MKTCKFGVTIKPPSRIFYFWEFLEIVKNNAKKFSFPKISRKLLELKKKMNMCERMLVDEYVYKILSRYIGKCLSSAVLNVIKGNILRYLRGFRYFSYFQILSHLGR